MLEGVRRFVKMVFSRDAFRIFTLPRSGVDYLAEVGDGTGSSTVAAPVQWVARTFPEAPPALWSKAADNQNEQVWDHPLLRLLERPNRHYSRHNLWMATTTDWMVDGNAYWIKVRSRANLPVELWWTPSWMMEPKGSSTDSSAFISAYVYTVDGIQYQLDPSEVVHFRCGLDPQNPRKGMSQLKSVLREVYTDDEAAAFTASLLRNMGVPGLIISPSGDTTISPEDAKATKDFLLQKFAGDKRGEPMVMTSATTVEQFGFSPEQLLLRELRRIPEERVTAVTGVPAIVAGLGAGLDRSTFTNMAEAREAAYESALIPMQRILAADVTWQLLSDFETDPFAWVFGFDLAHVRVLQEDRYRQVQRNDLAVRGGWEMVSEARRAAGLPVDPERDDVFLRPANVNVMRASLMKAGPTTVPNGNAPASTPANGNGSSATAEIAAAAADEVVRAIERERLLTP